MAYGAWFKNDSGAYILGEGVVPVAVSSNSELVSVSGGLYKPSEISGHFSAFKMKSSINKIVGETKQDNYSDFKFCIPDSYSFNNDANIGSVEFRYLAYGDSITYPSGGYGIVVRDESAQIKFHSNSVLYQPSSTHRLFRNDTVTIPNSTLVLVLAWHYDQPFNGPASYGILERDGITNTFVAKPSASNTTYTGMEMAISLFTT